jgi:hypothetical protein
MRKSCKRKQRPIYKPMMVVNFTCGQELEIANYTTLDAFRYGVADESHFRHFNDMANILLIAGTLRKEAETLAEFITNDVMPILTSIKARFERVGKLGLAGGDIDILRDFIQVYTAYWRQESSGFLVECQTQMQRFYREIEGKRAA